MILDPRTHASHLREAEALLSDHRAFGLADPEPERWERAVSGVCWIALVLIAVIGAYAVGNPVGWIVG